MKSKKSKENWKVVNVGKVGKEEQVGKVRKIPHTGDKECLDQCK